MNPESDPLLHLFRSAKKAPHQPPIETSPNSLSLSPPFGFTTRVLAQLRRAAPENPWEHLAVGALPIAAGVALLCFLTPELNFQPTAQPEDDLLAQAFLQTALRP